MADYLAKANDLVFRTRQFIRAVQRGPTEVTLFVFSIVCFSGATIGLSFEPVKNLLEGRLEIVRYVVLALGAISFVAAVIRIWRQAIPPELPPPEARPAAIKGPMPFTREDGTLFRRLGREDELSKLLGYVLDDQIPIVALMGESGAGKTSLLRAGLSHVLAQRNIRCIYWEALPSQPDERLLHAIVASWDAPKDGTLPRMLDEAIEALSRSTISTVIVLDQFEQLRPENSAHDKIFQILERAATIAMPPHRLTWVVAFRREYDPVWRDFELTMPGFHPPMLSLRMFTEDQARDIMATLGTAAGFTLDSVLIDDLTRAAANPEGRISAVDLGTGMLVLSSLAIRKRKSHLAMEDYRFAGGAEGILTAYISDRLERFGSTEREGVMKALLALADLDTNQRIAEGKTADELVTTTQLPAQRLVSCLEYLASPQVRLLQSVPATTRDAQRYRLPHERLIPSLRHLTGLILAEADHARLVFAAAFRSWLRTRRRRYLLSGTELRQVLLYRDQILVPGLPLEHELFLQQSVNCRFQRRAIIAASALSICILAFFFVKAQQSLKTERAFLEWRLPADLPEYQSQLETLTVRAPIPSVAWLRTKHLSRLKITSTSLRSISGLPSSLKHLTITECPNLATISGIEKLPQLTTLDLRANSNLQSLSGIEKLTKLTKLSLRSIGLTNLSAIDNLRTLETLDLSGNKDLRSLVGIEKLTHLKDLNLSGTGMRDLSGIERLSDLISLNLRGNKNINLSGLEKLTKLTKLDLGNTGVQSIVALENLISLTTLNLSSNKDLKSLVGIEKLVKLRELNLYDTGLQDLAGPENCPELIMLKLRGNQKLQSLSGIEKLTKVKDLALSGTGVYDLSAIEELSQLTSLDLSGNENLRSLSGIWKLTALTTLNLSGNRNLTNLTDLEKLSTLRSLNMHFTDLKNLSGIENLAALTTLTLSANYDLKGISGIEKLTALTDLNLESNFTRDFSGIEKLGALKTLDLSSNDLQTLSAIRSLTNLTTLRLSHAKTYTLAGIEQFESLTTLDLSDCVITDLKPLTGLKHLKTLNLAGTRIRLLRGIPRSVKNLTVGDFKYEFSDE